MGYKLLERSNAHTESYLHLLKKHYDGEGYTRSEILEDLKNRGYKIKKRGVNAAIRRYKINVVNVKGGVTRSMEELLGMLNGDMSVSDIASTLGVSNGSIYNRIRRLEMKGLYQRPTTPRTERKVSPTRKPKKSDTLNAKIPSDKNVYDNKPETPKYLKNQEPKYGIVDINLLTLAIKNSTVKSGMPEDQAEATALYVLNFFGYSERILDNVLEPEDRDAFYMLEDADILTTEREETTLSNGREWRIHYWMLRKEKIKELASGKIVKEEEEVYRQVPDDVWLRSVPEDNEDKLEKDLIPKA